MLRSIFSGGIIRIGGGGGPVCLISPPILQ
ncbi:hypothetical protein LINPERPRIM_LOCUS31950 [Linum perenne]